MIAATHQAIDPCLSGQVEELSEGRSRLRLVTTSTMRADELDLVHGGFVFSLADHAAMMAINHPNVVLGGAEVRFLRPVRVGEELVAEAVAEPPEGKKRPVVVTVRRWDQQAGSSAEEIFRGRFQCFLPPRHVLAGREGRNGEGD